MAKPISRGFTKWVIGVLCLSLLLGVAGFISPSAHAATLSVAASHTAHPHVHAPVKHSKPYCAPSHQSPHGCYGCAWDLINSAPGGQGSNYYFEVDVYAQYDSYSGLYCGYVAVQAALDQPPHSQVSTLNATLWGGCNHSCYTVLSNTIQVQPNNYYYWWYTNWVSTYYYYGNGCLVGGAFYLQLHAAYTSCIYV